MSSGNNLYIPNELLLNIINLLDSTKDRATLRNLRLAHPITFAFATPLYYESLEPTLKLSACNWKDAITATVQSDMAKYVKSIQIPMELVCSKILELGIPSTDAHDAYRDFVIKALQVCGRGLYNFAREFVEIIRFILEAGINPDKINLVVPLYRLGNRYHDLGTSFENLVKDTLCHMKAVLRVAGLDGAVSTDYVGREETRKDFVLNFVKTLKKFQKGLDKALHQREKKSKAQERYWEITQVPPKRLACKSQG